MNKLHLLHKAENLYCVENLTPEIIAEKLNFPYLIQAIG